jgi:hypothetical protein
MPRLQVRALEHALALPAPPGVYVECGVFSGASLRRIAESAPPGSGVYGFDSFKGLPESWCRPDMAFPEGTFALGRSTAPRPEDLGLPPSVCLVPGWFEDTIPGFVQERMKAGERIALLHVDCDLYSSTRTVLREMAPLLQDGTLIVFDELVDYPTYERHELRALHEFLTTDGKWIHLEWLGKLGDMVLEPKRDRGPQYQSVACRVRLRIQPLPLPVSDP